MAERVLIVAANLKIAGAQKMIEQLVLHINKNRFQIRLLVLSGRLHTTIEEHIENAGIDIRYLSKPNGFYPSFFRSVAKEINEFQPDIIHTHVNSWLYAVPSAVKNKITILHTIHSSPERQEANCLLREIITYLYKTKRAIPVAISDTIREDAVRVYHLPKERIERVYNPVDFQAFSSIEKSEHEGTLYVNVARFNAIKNQLFLIEAFTKAHKMNSSMRLVLAGDGELLNDAKELVEKLHAGDYVSFLGSVSDVPALLARCDVFVLPSLSEGMPISLLEAEAAGMPIIASRVGGIADVVDSNGILIDVNDEEALVDALVSLSNAKELRNAMGLRSQEIAGKYSSETIVKEYENLYKKFGAESQ